MRNQLKAVIIRLLVGLRRGRLLEARDRPLTSVGEVAPLQFPRARRALADRLPIRPRVRLRREVRPVGRPVVERAVAAVAGSDRHAAGLRAAQIRKVNHALSP